MHFESFSSLRSPMKFSTDKALVSRVAEYSKRPMTQPLVLGCKLGKSYCSRNKEGGLDPLDCRVIEPFVQLIISKRKRTEDLQPKEK